MTSRESDNLSRHSEQPQPPFPKKPLPPPPSLPHHGPQPRPPYPPRKEEIEQDDDDFMRNWRTSYANGWNHGYLFCN